MRRVYTKLVRDYIPIIIHQHGQPCAVEPMSDDEYREALRDKLIEEAQEVASANSDDLLKELADLHEVIDAFLRSYNIVPAEVHVEQERRRAERGGFEQRLRLLWTEEQ